MIVLLKKKQIPSTSNELCHAKNSADEGLLLNHSNYCPSNNIFNISSTGKRCSNLLGNQEVANEINLKLQELEERANELDKRRSSSIQLISYINNRNRRKNVEEAEKAIIEEARANKGLKFSDPFTRRSTKPKMAFKANQEPADEIMMAPEPPKLSKQKEKKNEEHSSADNLYLLHDFEIDLDVPLPMTNVAALPKPVETIQDSGPKIRRSLNLEDYKKKRGLI